MEFPSRRQHASRVISLVSLRNQLYFSGYWQTCKWLDNSIRKILKYFPVVEPSSPALGRHSYLRYEPDRMCGKLHRPLVRAWVVSPTIPSDPLDDSGALLKYFLKQGAQPFADSRHLERAGRPSVVDIKLRYVTPY
jgi:hypothetical protein